MTDVSGGRPSPEEARRLIFEDLDLSDAVRTARAAHHWTDEETADAELEYRRFLWLCYQEDGPVGAIHTDADRLWHHHILDTQGYMADCERIFGRYLHHAPAYGASEEDRQRLHRQGLERYQREYRRPLPRPTLSCSSN
jgi:hypothetical protein